MLTVGSAVDQVLGDVVRPAQLDIALLTLDPGEGDDFDRWVVDDVGRLVEYLRQVLPRRTENDKARRVVVSVVSVAPTSAWQAAAMDAAWQAVRGIVHSLTLELGARDIRLNAVRATDATRTALGETLAFLASGAAGFVAGSSFDLRPAR